MGKGSVRRPTDERAYRDGWDAVFGGEEQTSEICLCGMTMDYIVECDGYLCECGNFKSYSPFAKTDRTNGE